MAHTASVLLVEDEVLISNLMADWLNERGFCVHEAANADEALRFMDSGEPVDVLFTDVKLPGPMDGAELAHQARRRRPELPIVYVSGRYGPGELWLEPRSVFLCKPYNPEEICTLLARLTA